MRSLLNTILRRKVSRLRLSKRAQDDRRMRRSLRLVVCRRVGWMAARHEHALAKILAQLAAIVDVLEQTHEQADIRGTVGPVWECKDPLPANGPFLSRQRLCHCPKVE